MAHTRKLKKMTDAHWNDANEETPPLTNPDDATTTGGSNSKTTAPPKKTVSDLDTIAPLFFTNSSSDSNPFVTKLQVRGIQTMAALFAVGSYKAASLYSAFGERELIPQLAMLQTLANYIKSSMPKLVNTPAKHSKLEWDDIKFNGFDKTLFKIHVTVVYKSYVCALEKVFDLDTKKASSPQTNQPLYFRHRSWVPTRQKTVALLAPRPCGMGRSRHLKLSRAQSNPGSSSMTWTTSSNMPSSLNICKATPSWLQSKYPKSHQKSQ